MEELIPAIKPAVVLRCAPQGSSRHAYLACIQYQWRQVALSTLHSHQSQTFMHCITCRSSLGGQLWQTRFPPCLGNIPKPRAGETNQLHILLSQAYLTSTADHYRVHIQDLQGALSCGQDLHQIHLVLSTRIQFENKLNSVKGFVSLKQLIIMVHLRPNSRLSMSPWQGPISTHFTTGCIFMSLDRL